MFKKHPRIYLALFCGLLIVGGLIVASSMRDHTQGVADTNTGEAKTETEVSVEKTDITLPFDAETCEVEWIGANAVGLTPKGYFFKLDGTAILDDEKKPKSFCVDFDMKQLKAEAASLSKKLQGPGFFQTDTYPKATFVSTAISHQPRETDPPGTTDVIEGNLTIRDIKKSITFPVSAKYDKGNFTLTSKFKLNRKDFGVVHPSDLEDKAIRDDIVVNIHLKVQPKKNSSDAIAKTPSKTGAAGEKTVTQGPRFTEEIPATLVQFDMIRVPGDPSQGIKDFYIGKCEVTWEEFDYWALCEGLTDRQAVLEREKLRRPSPPHDLEKVYRGWGRKGQPAVGVSRKSAELYCQWLSEQTGRHYRLPTSKEWKHALKLGGDESVADKEKIAWFDVNAFGQNGVQAMKVGQLKPDKLGLYDMLGNAAEWVSDPDNPIVVGGDFLSREDELTADWSEKEDQEEWNKNYPQDPKSIWWYVDADYVGFRVVCDPENGAENTVKNDDASK